MRKPCVKPVEIGGKACVCEHFFYTEPSSKQCAMWVNSSLFRNKAPGFSLLESTAFWTNSPLFFSGFSPLSTGLITKPIIQKSKF